MKKPLENLDEIRTHATAALAAIHEWMTNDDPYAIELICEQVKPELAAIVGCECDPHDGQSCQGCTK